MDAWLGVVVDEWDWVSSLACLSTVQGTHSNKKCTTRAIFLLLLVARSKLIPDFALTLHFLHLIATTLYTHSVPANWLWWGLQGASAAFMTFLGIWACRWRELQPISFGGIGGSSSNGGTSAGASGGGEAESGAGEEESFSLSRGRGRGRGLRDSSSAGDEYEMVEMKGDAAV